MCRKLWMGCLVACWALWLSQLFSREKDVVWFRVLWPFDDRAADPQSFILLDLGSYSQSTAGMWTIMVHSWRVWKLMLRQVLVNSVHKLVSLFVHFLVALSTLLMDVGIWSDVVEFPGTLCRGAVIASCPLLNWCADGQCATMPLCRTDVPRDVLFSHQCRCTLFYRHANGQHAIVQCAVITSNGQCAIVPLCSTDMPRDVLFSHQYGRTLLNWCADGQCATVPLCSMDVLMCCLAIVPSYIVVPTKYCGAYHGDRGDPMLSYCLLLVIG